MKEQLGYGRQKPPKYKTPVKFDGGGCDCDNVYIGDGKCICWRCGKETPLNDPIRESRRRLP